MGADLTISACLDAPHVSAGRAPTHSGPSPVRRRLPGDRASRPVPTARDRERLRGRQAGDCNSVLGRKRRNILFRLTWRAGLVPRPHANSVSATWIRPPGQAARATLRLVTRTVTSRTGWFQDSGRPCPHGPCRGWELSLHRIERPHVWPKPRSMYARKISRRRACAWITAAAALVEAGLVQWSG